MEIEFCKESWKNESWWKSHGNVMELIIYKLFGHILLYFRIANTFTMTPHNTSIVLLLLLQNL